MKEKDVITQEMLSSFNEALDNFEYIDSNGRMDLEKFCVVLSKCFYADGIIHLSPKPIDVFQLLIELIQAEAQAQQNYDNLMALWVQRQKLVDWTPEFQDFYPDRARTLIHGAALLMVFDRWVLGVGNYLMDIPRSSTNNMYDYWVKPEWTHVSKLLIGLHNTVWKAAKEVDKSTIEESGFSSFEALALALKNDTYYEIAVESLKKRRDIQKQALFNIQQAIDSGFYLEAIALQESLISNSIYNFLKAQNKSLQSTSFFDMLRELRSSKSNHLSSTESRKLFKNVNEWRQKRNQAIHGFITIQIDEIGNGLTDFKSLSEQTANAGSKLASDVFAWYEQESVNFTLKERSVKKPKVN